MVSCLCFCRAATSRGPPAPAGWSAGAAGRSGRGPPFTGDGPPATGGCPPARGVGPPSTGEGPPASGGRPPATSGGPPATGTGLLFAAFAVEAKAVLWQEVLLQEVAPVLLQEGATVPHQQGAQVPLQEGASMPLKEGAPVPLQEKAQVGLQLLGLGLGVLEVVVAVVVLEAFHLQLLAVVEEDKLYAHHHYKTGYKSTTIVQLLWEEGLDVEVSAVCRLLQKYKETGTIARRPGLGRPTKVTVDVLNIDECQMRWDDETTAIQLQNIFLEQGHPLSLKPIQASRVRLGWTFRGSAYCQVITESNKQKRLDWVLLYSQEAAKDNGFEDVLWIDKSSIQLECHRRFSYRKKGEPAKPKPRKPIMFQVALHYIKIIILINRHKHPLKVNI
uniref:Transposase Tc1-like domain-containing protein n=3 Tax=Amphimedon queenslandica TaxID=400682 RepID=A0A1X7TRA5_AMPQE